MADITDYSDLIDRKRKEFLDALEGCDALLPALKEKKETIFFNRKFMVAQSLLADEAINQIESGESLFKMLALNLHFDLEEADSKKDVTQALENFETFVDVFCIDFEVLKENREINPHPLNDHTPCQYDRFAGQPLST